MTSLASTPFVVVDLETTGGSAVYDRVMEVAAIRFENGVVQERLERLVEPGVPIPPFVTRITGNNAALARGRPSFDSLLPARARLFQGPVVVAHNASFDCTFLSSSFRRAGLPWDSERLCTLRLARRLIPGLHSYRLDSLCAFIGFTFVQRHRAGPDAEATLSLLQHLIETAARSGIDSLTSLLRDFHDYPFIKLDLNDAFPRLEATRERPTDGVTYFGPFRRAGVVSSAVVFLNEQLGLRQCSGSLKPGQAACALLEMKKCLGPCVTAVAAEDHGAAGAQGVRTLRGEDRFVLDRAIQRRDELGEQLRFEEAAELRDRIRDVEQVIA